MSIRGRLVTLLGFAALSCNAGAASFDCSKASQPVETAICSDAELSALDEQLASAYSKVVHSDPSARTTQLEWVKKSRQCSTDASIVRCLKNEYVARIHTLNQQVETRGIQSSSALRASSQGDTVSRQVEPDKVTAGAASNNSVSTPVPAIASLESQLNLKNHCERFKSIESISKLASVLQNADKDVGLLAYSRYAGSFPNDSSWSYQTLLKFILNKLESIYARTAFEGNQFETTLTPVVMQCARAALKERDFRFFVMGGWINAKTPQGKALAQWLQTPEAQDRKYKSLFDAYEGFQAAMETSAREEREARARAKPMVLNPDGSPKPTPVEDAPVKNTTARVLFGNPDLPSIVSSANSNPFSGVARPPIDWDQEQLGFQNRPAASSNMGMKLALAALTVENGENAIESALSPFMKVVTQIVERDIQEARLAQKEREALADKGKLFGVDLDTIFKIIVTPIAFVLAVGAVYLYCRNFYFAVRAAKSRRLSVKIMLRYIGVFILILGVFMGAVKDESQNKGVGNV